MKPIAVLLVVALGAYLAYGFGETESLPTEDNLIDAVSHPADQQNDSIRQAAEKLTKSQVPTAEDARKLALLAFIKKPGLDAREREKVTGLYRIGRDVEGFAQEGDLVWEVRVTRLFRGVSGIVWVSTTTKTAKVLFPTGS